MEGFTKSFNIPLSHLDFEYIDKCNDINELEKIFVTLKIGEEGKYPELEKVCEDKVRKLNPGSRVLRKPTELKTIDQLEKDQRDQLMEDFQTWLIEMKAADEKIKKLDPSEKGDSEPIMNYPIRSKQSMTTTESNPFENKTIHKSCKPKDYNEWSKIADQLEKQMIVEESEEQNSKNKTECKPKTKLPEHAQFKGLSRKVDTTNLSKVEKEKNATLEKDKGNEAFRAGDFDEAAIYYCRSLSIQPNPSVYNNRGLIYMKQKKWEDAIRDFNATLKCEPSNVKALLRRATCYSDINNLPDAIEDCQKILKLSPNNKSAEVLLSKAEEELQKRSQPKLKDGKRMIITEVGSDEESSDKEDSDNTTVPLEASADNLIKEEYNLQESAVKEEGKTKEIDNSEDSFLIMKEKGNELFKELKYNEALSVYNELTTRWPTNPIGYRNKAACNLMLERPIDVIEDCTTAIKLDSTSHLSFYRRGKAYKILERYEESLKDLEEALVISPNHKQIKEEVNDVKALLYEQHTKSCDVDQEERMAFVSAIKASITSNNVETSTEVNTCDVQRSSPVSDTWEFLENVVFPHSMESNDDEENDEENNSKEMSHSRIKTIERSKTTQISKTEFDKKLKLIKIKYDWKSVIQLLVDIYPNSLSTMLGNKLDGVILERIISSLEVYSENKSHASFIKHVLDELEKVERFCFIKLMISDKSVEDLGKLFEFLRNNIDNLAEIECLQHKYQ